jgi:hypothetical protein
MPVCQICGLELASGTEMKRHAFEQHPAVADAPQGAVGRYGCKACGASFSSERALADHSRNEHGMRA